VHFMLVLSEFGVLSQGGQVEGFGGSSEKYFRLAISRHDHRTLTFIFYAD